MYNLNYYHQAFIVTKRIDENKLKRFEKYKHTSPMVRVNKQWGCYVLLFVEIRF